MSYLGKVKAAGAEIRQAQSEWTARYQERLAVIQEDAVLAPYAPRLTFLETLVEYLHTRHPGIISEFKTYVMAAANKENRQ